MALRNLFYIFALIMLSACATGPSPAEKLCQVNDSRSLAEYHHALSKKTSREFAKSVMQRFTPDDRATQRIGNEIERGQIARHLQLGDEQTRNDVSYWALYQASLKRDGKLRTDRSPSDAPYSNADLIETFRQIMFYDEFSRDASGYTYGRQQRTLEKRWDPVKFTIWGKGVSDVDRLDLVDVATRIRDATGLTLCETAQNADVEIAILNREERLSFAAKVRQAGAEAMAVDLENNLEGLVCGAYYFDSDALPGLVEFTIIIPDELNSILRKSCIEEEFGQAFGPSADYDGARPSIFNDDEEFAFFTEHDALLFRILYDARLRDGMEQEAALPIVRQIVSELRPNG